jgi:hypothetical protein
MEFSPSNKIVNLCIQAIAMEERGEPEKAARLLIRAWEEATDDFEKFLAAHFVARHQDDVRDRLKWSETSLHFAREVNDEATRSALPSLHSNIAQCYEELDDVHSANRNREMANSFAGGPDDKGPFYHGTKAGLAIGDLLTPGGNSNYKDDLVMNHIYFTALVHGAGLAASLAKGDGRERVYIVEPTGAFENDPNVTDKKFPGNLTRSYRSTSPLKIVGEVEDWARQTPQELQKWKERLANVKGEIIN